MFTVPIGEEILATVCVLFWLKGQKRISCPLWLLEEGLTIWRRCQISIFFQEEEENVICVCLAVMGQRQNAGSVPWEFWKVFWLCLLVVIGVICLQMFILTGGRIWEVDFFFFSFFPFFTGSGLVIGKCYQRQIGHTWLLKGSRDRHCDLVNDWTWPPTDFSFRHALSSCAGNGTPAR